MTTILHDTYTELEKEIELKTIEIIDIENIKLSRTLSIITKIDSYKSKAFRYASFASLDLVVMVMSGNPAFSEPPPQDIKNKVIKIK